MAHTQPTEPLERLEAKVTFEANKELVRRHFEEIFNRKNLAVCDDMVPSTGKRFTTRQGHWFIVADGKLAEHWATRDDLTAMLQLGVVRPPGRSPL